MRDQLVDADFEGDPALLKLAEAVRARFTEQQVLERARHGYPRGSVYAEMIMTEHLEGSVHDEILAGRTQALAEWLRVKTRWYNVEYPLNRWIERELRDPYLVNRGSDWDEKWELRPDADPSAIPPAYFELARYVAICELRYGPSYASYRANLIFTWMTLLGSDLPARLKRDGTGELPADLARLRADGVSAVANDALATVRVTFRTESAASYQAVLEYLCRLLEETSFPRSYAIDARGLTKTWLPVAKAPKKGVHALFANAAAYPELWSLLERYARTAMRDDEWYTNLGEDAVLPGTFAVFSLGFADPRFAPLVIDYLNTVDGEHQSLQGAFVEAYVDAHGFTTEALDYLAVCAGNIQDLRHRKIYPRLLANTDALHALVALKASLSVAQWRPVMAVLWPREVRQSRGEAVIASAPEELKDLYRQVFA